MASESVSPVPSDGYRSLLHQVKKILSEGKERARLAVEYERVRAYWEAGDALRAYLKRRDSQYGSQVVGNLPVDTSLSMHKFYEIPLF